MSNKKLSLLGLAAAGSVVLAVFVWQFANRVQPASAEQGNLIQGLDTAAIAQIAVRHGTTVSQQVGKGPEMVSLKRKENGFVVANKSNYPASNRQINDLIAACLDIRCVELYTEDKANFKDLGVSEEDAKDVVKFLDSNGKIITGVIIGDLRQDERMAYGRLVGDSKVYVIYNVPWVKSSPLDYIEQELISVGKSDINSVTVTIGADSYTLATEANGTEPVLSQLPIGKQQKKNDCLSVFGALTNLRFDDVNAAADCADLIFDKKYSCMLKDSTLYTIEIAGKESKTFIKCSVEFTDKTQVKKEQAVESQEELEKKDAKLLAKGKAKKLQETCEGWIYQIPEYKAKNMTKPLAELVEDIATVKPADANVPE
jgi:hypothetical protein